MISFKEIDSLICGQNGFESDTTHPYDDVYWNSKLSSEVESEYFIKYDYLRKPSYLNILSIILLGYNYQPSLSNVRKSYYHFEAESASSQLIRSVSNSIKSGDSIDIDSVLLRIRWYIFECQQKANKYFDSYSRFIKHENPDESEDLIGFSNFEICMDLIDKLISTYNVVVMVSRPVSHAGIDIYLKNVPGNLSSVNSLVHLFDENLSNYISKNNTGKVLTSLREIVRLLDVLKVMYAEGRKFHPVKGFYNLRNHIVGLEDMLLKRELTKLFSDEDLIKELKTLQGEDFYQTLYIELNVKFSKFILPNERINCYEETIIQLSGILNDAERFDVDTFENILSCPRRIIKRLKVDLETVKANLSINLLEFDRNRIKPIKVNLTVAQLALLFRLLSENNIVNAETKSELFNTVCKAFESKFSSVLSTGSFKNKFNDTDIKEYEFWKKEFLELSRKSIKS